MRTFFDKKFSFKISKQSTVETNVTSHQVGQKILKNASRDLPIESLCENVDLTHVVRPMRRRQE